MVLIDFLLARQILNGRGEPAVEVEILLTNGEKFRASTPSGKSVSKYEALDLVDKDFSNYFGKSVEHAVTSINTIIAPRLKKLDPAGQEKIDQILQELDSTPNMAHLGTNATLSVSIAVAKAAASAAKKETFEHINDLFCRVEVRDEHDELFELLGEQSKPQLPMIGFNLIGGGEHADNKIPIQEFLIYVAGVPKMADQIRAAAEIRWQLGNILQKDGQKLSVNDEGAFVPDYADPFVAFQKLVEAVNKTNYHLHNGVLYGFDIAGNEVPPDFIQKVTSGYPIVAIEDPFNEDAWGAFTDFNATHPDIFTVGDDLTATNLQRLYQAINNRSVDCVIVKPNQIGTITETLKFAKVAKHANIALYAAHRSGETNDSFIVDLAVGIGAKFAKFGAPVRGERVAKYNHLLELALKFEDR